MGLFWSGNELGAIRREQSAAWLDDLSEFPAEIVETACREWRRDNRKSPKIADIRALCFEQSRRDETSRSAEWQPKPKPPTPAELELKRRREKLYADAESARDRWARECGATNFADAWHSGNLVDIGNPHPLAQARRAVEADMTLPLESTKIPARASPDAIEDVL